MNYKLKVSDVKSIDGLGVVPKEESQETITLEMPSFDDKGLVADTKGKAFLIYILNVFLKKS